MHTANILTTSDSLIVVTVYQKAQALSVRTSKADIFAHPVVMDENSNLF